MFRDVRSKVKKAGQSPGTPTYVGSRKHPTEVTLIQYSAENYNETITESIEAIEFPHEPGQVSWLQVDGLSNTAMIEKIASHYHLHPLTLEDILTVDQRPKVEEFPDYLFVTLKVLAWNTKKKTFSVEELSLILGHHFVLSFQERESVIFSTIKDRLKSTTTQRLRQHGADYLFYRLLDTVVDQYFIVLEKIGEQIETAEERILYSPNTQRSRLLYQLKRRILLLRKIIWPVREVISHLFQTEEKFISPFTTTYLRDVYDHTVQAIDTTETFRDILSSMLDVYLSNLTNRMNEVMKILTIISTIFIPMTFIASIYGMNFDNMPELHTKYGYFLVLGLMVVVAGVMIRYFRKKKWL